MMNLHPISSKSADWAAHHVMGQYDAPAYIRRARQMEGAIEQLVESCRIKRHEWLEMVRLRLGVLHALAGDWAALVPLLADAAHIRLLEELAADIQPRLRWPVESTSSRRRLRTALQELQPSVGRFNRRWSAFLTTVDLGEVNKLIDGYNRYYLLEKECVVRSAPVARLGFRPRQHLNHEWLTAQVPPLPLPTLKS